MYLGSSFLKGPLRKFAIKTPVSSSLNWMVCLFTGVTDGFSQDQTLQEQDESESKVCRPTEENFEWTNVGS